MNRFLPVLLLLIMGCKEKILKSDLHHLNGYWEIEKVVFPDGGSKKYGVNTTIDFFTIEGTWGYRKKVQPIFDGSFKTSDDAESFTVLEDDGDFIIQYRNELAEWKERIEKISDDQLTIVNDENIRYHYKRFHLTHVE
jgi:hypothetical protein